MGVKYLMAEGICVTVLPARGCRRSRRIMEYLAQHGISYAHVALESAEGQALAAQYDLHASPGILVDGVSVNPFDLLESGCRVNEAQARRLLLGE